ncbi:MAG: lamin tail domain-containing protein, partial [Chthoniobacteraceae bacterium]
SMNVWQHHTVVKTGSTLTYYRNGTVAGSRAISGPLENVQPLYFGGDKAQESWPGKLDDVAIWTKALPISSVEGLADGSYTPLTAPTGSVAANLVTEVAEGPVTHYFRRKFNFTAAKARTTLTLQHSLDDGAVFYLNGTEVHRVNLPDGAITHTTPAVAPVGHAALSTEITIPTTALVVGENVLTVEVHQHSADPDMLFGASLVASVEPAPPRFPGTGLVFNEISGAGDPQFQVELINLGGSAVDLAGYQIVSSSGAVGTLTGGSVAPGALLVIDAAQLGFTPLAGDKLFLLQPGGVEFEDAQEVTSRLRGRAEGWNRTWLFPSAPSFGAANAFSFNDSVVINELMYNPHQHQVAQEQWVELFNRGAGPVDLTGWSFSEGITYAFPAGTILAPGAYLVITSSPADFAQNHPGVTALGPFTGKLAGSGERVTLRDASGNPADQVRYFDAGRWDDLADGGGSSLERRNAFAASTSPENWAGSDETGRSEWQTITYSGSGANVGTNVTQWHEFVFGLLSKGSFLIDDISVIESPTGARIQLIQNGNFSSGQNTWRLLGTHRRGTIVDDNGNPALRVDASGFTEHMHNHVETTLKNGASYVTLSPSKQYEISFRAKWLGGNNLLNTRLYFNRLPRTTALPVSPKGGTPGAVNSRNTSNLGPTYQGLTHSPAVPQAGQAATVSVRPSSPVGLGGLTLFHRLDGGAFSQVPMSDPDGDGVFSGTIPPQTAGARVQFYVQATDTAANTSFFPAAGPESRALIPWYNGEAGGGAAANFRIVMLTEDSNFLHSPTQVMSDDPRGATVIYRENEIYYDVGVRLKGSQRGRGSNIRVGWHLRFPPHDAFLGAHITMTIDRSGAGDQFSQKEILVIHALNRAGNIPGSYDDLVRVIAPRAVHTGSAMMQKARFSDVFLDGQWDNGADGPMFEYELIYYPTTTQGGSVEGLKLPQPDNVVGTAVTGLGANKEAYRWHYLQKNNRQADNYATIMAAATAMGLPSGTQFLNETRAKLDVDQWLRAFAIQQLFGIGDSYAVGGQHNAVFYTRPTDGKTLYFPKDMDFTFSQGATSGIAAGDLSKLIADGANRRAYYGHLLDIIDRSFNTTYMGPWAQHYTSFLEGENLTVWMSYINQRSNYVRSQVNGAIPQVAFNVTTNGGQPL